MRCQVTTRMIVVACVVAPDDDPVTVIVYVPAGVPLGLTVLPALLLELPQPAANAASNRASTPIGISSRIRRLRIAKKVANKIPRTANVSAHGSRLNGLLGANGGTPAVREVVVMTKGTVEFAFTEAEGVGHAAPVGNPEQVSVYATFPVFVIVYVADEPAATVCETGDELNMAGFTVNVKFCVKLGLTPFCAVITIG